MRPATGIRVLNGIQCIFWVVFGLYFAAGTLADPPVAPAWLGMSVAGTFVFRGVASGGLALFRPGSRGFLTSALLYLLSAWPMGIVLLAFAFLTPVEFGTVIMGLFGALLLWQALRSQAAMEEVLRLLRSGGVPEPTAFGLDPSEVALPARAPPAPTGPPAAVLLWGAPFSEVQVEDRGKLAEALREGRIQLLAASGGQGPVYIGVYAGSLPGGRSSQELPKEAVIRDPGTSQAFRAAGVKAAPGRAFLVPHPRPVREVPP